MESSNQPNLIYSTNGRSNTTPNDNTKATKGKRKTPTKQQQQHTSSDDDSDGGEIGPDGQRREKRLEKNREAAQLFRQRQKAYLEELEKKVDELATENADSKSKIELLNSENKVIKEQLAYVRSFIGQALSVAGTLNPSVFNNAPQNTEQSPAVTTPNNNNNGDSFTTMGSLMQMLTPQMQTQLFQFLTQPNGATDLTDMSQQIDLDPSFFQLLPELNGANNENFMQTEKENQQ